MAAEDPDYIQKYDEASGLNARFEALQAQLAELEAATPSAPATTDATAGPDVAGAIDGIDTVAPPDGVPPAQYGAAVPQEPEAAAPPAPKYVTVERVRVEVEKIHEQSWSFVGIASNVSPAVQEIANNGGYVSENLLEKKFGKLTILCPFEVDFQIGGMISAYSRRSGSPVGLIYYPQANPSSQASATLGQLLQQFVASSAPRGHVVAFLKVNKVEAGDDKVSIIVGGLTEQDSRIQQGLKRLGNVFYDNGIFFKGALLDDIKSMASKLGIKLVTLVATSNVIQNQDKLQALVESF
ncbi:MAG: hypothetical protein JW839_00510 [Candidatus Lokiarchaeota archaeon]|nr:hypothetical protein [Candidatus Lokiarchaeota archaeon]